ncbi:MAG: YARHG domain-containing protein [Azospirillaceae bacterium]
MATGTSFRRGGATACRLAILLLMAILTGRPDDAPAQDNSCVYAGDGICQAWPFAELERFCVPGTDHGDCRGREVLFGSDIELVEPERLIGQTPAWLRLARNEIFARHGAFFRSDDLAAFFATRDWYARDPGVVSLTPVEQANVATIQEVEAAPFGPISDAGWPTPTSTWTATLVIAGRDPLPVFGSPTTLRLGAPGADEVTFVNLTAGMLHIQDGDEGIGVGLGAVPDVIYPTPGWLADMGAVVARVGDRPEGRVFAVRGAPDWADGAVTVEGRLTVNTDGVVVDGSFGWRWQECCGGETTEWIENAFRLEDFAPHSVDPTLFVPDRRVDWVYPG